MELVSEMEQHIQFEENMVFSLYPKKFLWETSYQIKQRKATETMTWLLRILYRLSKIVYMIFRFLDFKNFKNLKKKKIAIQFGLSIVASGCMNWNYIRLALHRSVFDRISLKFNWNLIELNLWIAGENHYTN